MRLREAADVYDNREQAAEELRLIYPDFNIDHIDPELTRHQYLQLYSSDGNMEKKNAHNLISHETNYIPQDQKNRIPLYKA